MANSENSYLTCIGPTLFYLFNWDLTSLSTLYRSYHNRLFYGQRKALDTVGQASVL